MTVAAEKPLPRSARVIRGKTSPSRRLRQIAIAYALLLTTAVAALYAQTAWFKFVGVDDPSYVWSNPLVRKGFTWDGFLQSFVALEYANWHPLTWLSHMLDCQLYGLKPGGHHLTSAALHAVNAGLLFFVLWRMTRPREGAVHQALSPDDALRAEYWSLGQSAFVAAIFALHPLRAESVAWVSERKDVLSGMFWILTVGAYTWYSRRPSWQRYLAVAILFALGLMAKPSLVTLPMVLLLLDYWPLGRFGEPGHRLSRADLRRLVLEKLPLFALSLASCVVTVVAQRKEGAIHALYSFGIVPRLANVVVTYAAYIRDTFWPVGLACFYPLDYFVLHRLPIEKIVASIVLLVAISVLVACYGRRYRFLTVGWLWYLIVLVPMVGLVQVGEQARADRYTYLSSIGLAMMVAWGLPVLLKRWRYRAAALGATALACIGACTVATWYQIGYWRNSEVLCRHALAVTTKNYVAGNGLGVELLGQNKLDEAIECFEQSIRDYTPREYQPTSHNLSLALNAKAKEYLCEGYIEKTLKCYRHALEIRPDWNEMANNLAWMLATRPEPHLRSEDESLFLAKKLCEIDGSKTAAYVDTLAAAYAASGQYLDAVRTGEAAIRLADAAHDEETAKAIRDRVERYRSGQPYREP